MALDSPCCKVQGTRVGEASGEPAQCLPCARRDAGVQEGRGERPQSRSTLQGQTWGGKTEEQPQRAAGVPLVAWQGILRRTHINSDKKLIANECTGHEMKNSPSHFLPLPGGSGRRWFLGPAPEKPRVRARREGCGFPNPARCRGKTRTSLPFSRFLTGFK